MHKGLLWIPDGIALYYTGFVYAGDLLRDGIAQVFSGDLPQFSTYTFYQGYGSDYLPALGSIVTNPLNLLSAVVPQQVSEYAFYITIWLRVVLAGFTFSLYCFNRGKGYGQTLVGALCYQFCGFVVFWGILRHPIFIDMAITLPCVLLGADRIFARQRPLWFIAGIGATFFLSAYYTYMTCMFLLAYCVVMYFFAPRERSVKDFALLVLRFVGYLALGLCLGAVCGIPYVISLLSVNRVGQDVFVPLHHGVNFYVNALSSLVGLNLNSRGMFVGVVPLFASVVFVACRDKYDKDEWRPWLVALVLCGIAMCIPWFGHAINGFNYVTSRWMVMLGFIAGYITCLTVPVLKQLSRRDAAVVGALLLALTCLMVVPYASHKNALVSIAILVVLVAATYVVCWKRVRVITGALCVLVLAGASFAAVTDMTPIGAAGYEGYLHFGRAYSTACKNVPSAAIADIDDDSTYRYTYTDFHSSQANSELVTGVVGTSYYASAYNAALDDFRDGLGIWSNHKNFMFGNNDGRLAIDALSGAKYCSSRDESSWLVPYSYEPTGAETAGFKVYETDLALPLAFTCDRTYARSDYDKLNMVQKQEALVQSCVIADDENGLAAEGHEAQPVFTSKSIDYTVEPSDGASMRDGDIVVTKKNSSIKLKFKGLPKSETYLCLGSPIREPLEKGGAKRDSKEGPPGPQPNSDELSGSGEEGKMIFSATCAGCRKDYKVSGPNVNTYVKRSGIAINFGYHDDAVDEVELTFERKGINHFDSIEIICQPVEPIAQELKGLKSGGAESVTLGAGMVSAQFKDVAAQSYAIVTIPYSSGWSATIDGKAAPVVRGDVGFCAVPIADAGSHEVKLNYETPGGFAGALLSAFGALAFLALLAKPAVAARLSRRDGRSEG